MRYFTLTLLACLPLLAATPSYAQPQINTNTPTELAAQATATPAFSGDTVEKFVSAEFDQQIYMLEHWQGDSAIYSQLLKALEDGTLYFDSQNRPYLYTDQVVDFYSAQPVNVEIDSLTSLMPNNEMRSAIDRYHATKDLASSDVSVRLGAAQKLAEDASAADPALIAQRIDLEKDAQVRELLQSIKAQIDLSSSDTQRQLAAVALLGKSSSPDVAALVDQHLESAELAPAVKTALLNAKADIGFRIKQSEYAGYAFSGLSLASVLLLAALGLAITYGLLGVINMAHGELIMIGAYTTYVIQNLFVQYASGWLDAYLIVAIPAAFLVSALVGILIERLVIRPLYGRQLETLLATFGVSLILMQTVRMLFGAQNVEVANVAWLSGGWQISSSLVLPYSRIFIIGFSLAVVLVVYWLLVKTRFGLFVRAVTQNRQMAKAIGVRSSRVDSLAFGLGSGLAGLAGCVLSQIGNVGPDLGQQYIIDAFLVVVVGGVGQLMGAILAALGLGLSAKMLEVMMGAVVAKIILLVLIILFIQRRPKGLFALKGRFVE